MHQASGRGGVQPHAILHSDGHLGRQHGALPDPDGQWTVWVSLWHLLWQRVSTTSMHRGKISEQLSRHRQQHRYHYHHHIYCDQ